MRALAATFRLLLAGVISASFPRRGLKSFAPGQSLVTVPALILLGVAVRVRLYAANGSYWYDEAYLLLQVFNRTFLDLVGRNEYNLVSPPGQLLIERAAYVLFGAAEWAMRLPAFVAGVAALPLLAALGRQIVGRWAWVPVACMVVSRNFLIHGCEARGYTIDALVAILVMLATVGVVRSGRLAGRAAALLALTAAGPWLSFPSVFVLGGAGAAVLVRAAAGGGRRFWGLTAAMVATILISGGCLWYFQARHVVSPGLVEHWGPAGWGGFPDWSRPLAIALWPLRCGVEVGNYGTRGMGIPLLLLAAIGVRRLAREDRSLAALFAVPGLLAVAASFLEKYPLADRTVMFLLPGLWVSAAAGLAEVAARFPGRREVALLPFVLLAPGAVGVCQNFVRPPTPPPARQAFEIVRANRRPGDVVWVSHAEVYYAYYGREEDVFGCLNWPADVARAAAGRPVWLVDQPAGEASIATPLVAALRGIGYVETERRTYPGVVLMRYAVGKH